MKFQPVYGIDSFKESKILIIKMESDKNGNFIYDIDTYSQICKNIIKALPPWITAICLPPGISVEWLER